MIVTSGALLRYAEWGGWVDPPQPPTNTERPIATPSHALRLGNRPRRREAGKAAIVVTAALRDARPGVANLGRRMRRSLSIVVALALVLAPAAPAAAAAGSAASRIITECYDHGKLSGSFTAAQLRAALAQLPASIAEYSDCATVIRQQLDTELASTRGSTRDGGGAGGTPVAAIVIVAAIVVALGGAGGALLARRRQHAAP
jgi:hypothetical protein